MNDLNNEAGNKSHSGNESLSENESFEKTKSLYENLSQAEIEVKETERSDRKNLRVPAGVSNPEAYFEYIDLMSAFEKTKGRYKQTSDPKLIVDLATSIAILKKMMRHLPMEEQDEIISMTTPFRQEVQRIGLKKRQAFDQLKETKESSEFSPLTVKQSELLEYFGKFYTIKEVHRIVVREWGYDITLSDVKEFYSSNILKISELQKEFEQSHDNIRLGKRRSRLEELSFIYAKLKDKFIRSEDSIGLASSMKGLLEAIKRECDGDLVINGKMKIEVEQSINIQIYQDIMKDFNLTQLIITRVAGKLNVNPLFILSRLAHSNYAKFTGFAKPDISKDEDVIPYSSQIVYDFDRLRSLYEKNSTEDESTKALPEIIDKVEYLSLKDQLLQQIMKKKVHLEDTENDIYRNSN